MTDRDLVPLLEQSIAHVQQRKMRQAFDDGYIAEPNSGCWLWTKSLNNKGYGKLCGLGDGKSMLAHRYSYMVHRGPILVGLVLDHKCRTPACVNPDHLEPVTQQENMRRSPRAHVLRSGRCARGHVTEIRRGRSYCRQCNSLWHRENKKCRTGSR